MQVRDERLLKVLQNNRVIRVFISDAPGFGNQAASVNLVTRLRQMGFTGIIEIVYPCYINFDFLPCPILDKITVLFDLPKNIPPIYSNNDGLVFYSLDAHLRRLFDGSCERVTFALTGAMDFLTSDLVIPTPERVRELGFELRHDVLFNYANLLNADIFIAFSPYLIKTSLSRYKETSYHLRDLLLSFSQPGSGSKFLVVPPADFFQAEKFLASDRGKLLLERKPALETLVAAYKNKSINFIPSYGYPLDERHPQSFQVNNIVEIIAGARYAQLKAELNGPLIIPLFYDLSDNRVQKIFSFIENPSSTAIGKAIKTLGLQDILSITKLSEVNASEKIKNVKAGEILLVATGELPIVVFNSLFAHTASNILLQVREGASSLTSLVQTGRPHLRCGGSWELDLDRINDTGLVERMQDIGINACFDYNDWSKTNVPERIGQYIIDAQNPDSSLSKYFRDLKEMVLDPENDRIVAGLQGALKVLGNTPATEPPLTQTDNIISPVTSQLFSSSTANAIAGFIAASTSRLINNRNAGNALLAAPQALNAMTEMNETPSLRSTLEEMNAQTWLHIGAVSLGVTACLLILARKVQWRQNFNYFKDAIAQTFYGNQTREVSGIESLCTVEGDTPALSTLTVKSD